MEIETSLEPVPPANTINTAYPSEDESGTKNSTARASSLSAASARRQVHLEVIIPAYNEADRITATLGATVDFLAAQPWSSRIVVVDNGSADDTGSVVRRIAQASDTVDIHLMGCAHPGKGAAVRRGLLSSRSTFAGFLDADLATPIATLEAAMTYLEAGAAAVIASRHAPGSTFVQPQHLGRRVGGTAFRLMTRRMVQGIADTQCGFKFFEVSAVKRALVECRTMGFAFDVELLQRIQHSGGRVLEIPVSWTDGPASTFRPIRDGLASFGAVLQMQRMS
ncbi:glycosyltransferase [uncultured Arthrobacter sp.]|uniref:glycosyltransferase n=1 Tax=uncultured Arthrobacter sp. TaxID=114050 RepID=UPI00261738DE|nr:glycosyltransferase [uncultured Arthrobacter sp.]